MKTSVIKLIVTIAAVGMCANAALAKKGNSGGNAGGNGGNRSAFKLNTSNGNSNISRSLSSSSSNSNKLFKFNGNGNGNNNSLSKVLKLNGNNNGSSQQLFKSNGNNGNKNNNIFSNNSNKKINISQLLSGNKNDSGNKFFTKKDFCFDGKCFPKHCHDGCCYPHWYHYCHSYPSYPCYGHISTIVVGVGYEPLHCNYVVLPGDTLYGIAFMEYGTSVTAKDIAAFNRLGLGAGLTPGLILNLPSISPSGALNPSGAPIADALRLSPVNANAMRPAGPMIVGGPVGPMTSTAGPMAGPTGPIGPVSGPAGPMTPNAGTSPVAPQTAPRPTMMAGSSLQVDGQVFGDKPGMARLLIGGKALQIDVLEWFSSAIKIRLPQVVLTGPSSAEIEILRADGSLAAKTPVELVPATGVALTK